MSRGNICVIMNLLCMFVCCTRHQWAFQQHFSLPPFVSVLVFEIKNIYPGKGQRKSNSSYHYWRHIWFSPTVQRISSTADETCQQIRIMMLYTHFALLYIATQEVRFLLENCTSVFQPSPIPAFLPFKKYFQLYSLWTLALGRLSYWPKVCSRASNKGCKMPCKNTETVPSP